MGSKRRLIDRAIKRNKITQKAIEIFRDMLKAEQREDWDKWFDLNGELGRQLGLKVWQWPPIERPETKCAYPPGTAGAEWFPNAVKLFETLSAAVADRRAFNDI
jgi:hypothetical protein